jgi:hypothetical protein
MSEAKNNLAVGESIPQCGMLAIPRLKKIKKYLY